MLILHGHVKYKWIGSILTLFWCFWHGHAKIRMFMPNWFPSYCKNNISSPFCTIMQKFHMFMWNWHSFDSSLCSFLQSSLSCFQIWFAHRLKHWILDFMSFKMIYSMPKNNLEKYSKYHLKVIVHVTARIWVPIGMYELQAISFNFISHVCLLFNSFHNLHFFLSC